VPTITKITEQKRRANRRNVHLDGRFAFGCSANVVAKFRLREGVNLTDEQVRAIEQGQVRQECFDAAMKLLERRLHARAELQRKLQRREFGESVVGAVLDDLTRLGYINDAQFAKAKALSAVQHKQHGRRRAYVELMRSGVDHTTAGRAVEDVYDTTDSLAIARRLAQKQAPRLRRLDPLVARRRLAGMLLRRGFEYQTVRPVIDEVLGDAPDPADE